MAANQRGSPSDNVRFHVFAHPGGVLPSGRTGLWQRVPRTEFLEHPLIVRGPPGHEDPVLFKPYTAQAMDPLARHLEKTYEDPPSANHLEPILRKTLPEEQVPAELLGEPGRRKAKRMELVKMVHFLRKPQVRKGSYVAQSNFLLKLGHAPDDVAEALDVADGPEARASIEEASISRALAVLGGHDLGAHSVGAHSVGGVPGRLSRRKRARQKRNTRRRRTKTKRRKASKRRRARR